MKKTIALMLAMLTLLMCLSACGAKEEPAAPEATAAPTGENAEAPAIVVTQTTAEPDGTTPTPEPTAEPVTVSIRYDNQDVASLSFMTSSVFQLKAACSNGAEGGTWTSGDASVASVDENGVVTCWKAGSTKITYTVGEASASCTLKVDEPTVRILFGTEEKNDISLSSQWGYEIQLTAVVSPAETQVTWSSSDEAIATVSDTGYVTAKRGGNATIYAKCGTAKAECIIRVLGTPPAQVQEEAKATPDPNDKTPRVVITYAGAKNVDFTISVGTSVDMNYDLYNIDQSNPVEWSIEDTSIATVNENGVVTGVKKGNTKLICTCAGNKCECIVRITEPNG